jgi:hypothetical protein
MNVSASPPLKPPVTLDATISSSRPVRPMGGKIGGPVDARPLPPVNDKPIEPTRTRPADSRSAPGDAPNGPIAPPDMYNVEGLLDAWGSSDSPYDLDANGSVDAWDLSLFLGGQRPKSDEPTYNVEGLLEHWGQSDSAYDLDGNGNVDAWDLALFLGGERPGEPAQPPATNDPTNSANGAPADALATETQDAQRPGPEDGQAFLDRFTRFVFRTTIGREGEIPLSQLKVNDQQAARLDPDGDGIVKRADLKELIQANVARQIDADDQFRPRAAAREWINRLGGPGAHEALVSRPGEQSERSADDRLGANLADGVAKREAALTRLSSFVSSKLEGAGFREHPPRNLHAVIGQLNVTGADRSFLLKQLAEKYPDGLGINRVG